MTPRRTDQSAIHTWLVLMKAHRTLTRHATRSIEALDMCPSDSAILEALRHTGPQSVGKHAGRIALPGGLNTAPIYSLSTRHLVARADNAPDRSAWMIHLPPPRKTLMIMVTARNQDTIERAMSGLSKADRATLTDLLR